MRVWVCVVVGFTLFMTGCLDWGASQDLEEPPQGGTPVETGQDLHLEEHEFRADVSGESPAFTGAWVYPAPTRVTEEWTFDVESGSQDLEVGLRWSVWEENDFRLVVEHPGGTDEFEAQEPQTVNAVYEEPANGTWTVYATTQGLVRGADTVVIDVAWHRFSHPDRPRVPVVEQEDGWFASLSYVRSRVPQGALDVQASTFNGMVFVEGTRDEKASVEVRTWARAPSEEEARGLLGSMNHTLLLTNRSATALVEGEDEAAAQPFGADIVVRLPTSMHGSLNSTRGDIRLADVSMEGGLDVLAMDGGVDADVSGYGDLSVVALKGPVDLGLTPQWNTNFSVESAMDVALRLTEGNGTGYDIETITDDGDVDVEMEDAALDGARVQTQGFADRHVQGVGNVASSGGDITIDGVVAVVDPVAPGAPEDLSVGGRGGEGLPPQEVTLRWNAPTDDGGALVALYHVYRDDSRIATVDASQARYVDNAENGEAHHYHVTAENMAGEGAASNTVCSPPDFPGATGPVFC